MILIIFCKTILLILNDWLNLFDYKRVFIVKFFKLILKLLYLILYLILTLFFFAIYYMWWEKLI